ncbi:MAG TPA: polysaccharide biosynthesis/export family protein [Devosiaceae bacterium]|nr:polysaccharide biosynthesis/export family protein [Devosiaceae bacterium]
MSLLVVVPLAGCAVNPASYRVTPVGPYELNTGDVVRVTVYGDKDLSNTYKVDDSGSISFPLVGPVHVAGATTEGAAARLSAALAHGFMRNPNVVVEVADYRPFFIEGAVNNSGQFTYVYGMSARAAISTAGGFKDTADQAHVTIYRPVHGTTQTLHVTLDFPILPGDTVVVGERWF